MADLYVMCGIPGSGKSTVARRVASQKPGAVIVSSDAMRERYFGGEGTLYNKRLCFEYYNKLKARTGDEEEDWRIAGNKFIFEKVDAAAKQALKDGHDVIYDATSLSVGARKLVWTKLSKFFEKAFIVYIDCPLELALERNANRARKVPENRIREMYRRLAVPSDAEVKEVDYFDGIITIKMQ